MAKSVHNDVLDGGLNIIKNNATTMILCDGQPTDRADALSKALADVAVTGTDFTAGDGDVSGRKLAVAAKSAVPVDSSGDGDHLALIDGTRLLYVTTCTLKVVTAGDQVNIPTWDIEIADPT